MTLEEMEAAWPEHLHQARLFRWADESGINDLQWMFAVPNGGKRHPATAWKLKLEGVKPGVPDIILPLARQKYHGLMIEMKRIDGKPSKKQDDWHVFLTGQGYRVEVCEGWRAAKAVIMDYISGKT